jgi:acetyl-CoA carboxylase biotin carboxyl carrier protein
MWIPGKDATMAEKDGDLKRIKELIEIMDQNGLAEIEIKHGDDKIVLKRYPPQQPAVAGPVMGVPESATARSRADVTGMSAIKIPPSAAPQEEDLVEIKSPIVGTFYATPSPDSEPYVEVGSHVEPQTVVCIIEAMKVMNEIKAETSGTIAEVLVTNGQAVEYGQVLFRIRPD